MGLETSTYIDGLVATNPTGSDNASTADDHCRLIKSTIKNTFPNVAGAVTPTHTELNYVDGVTSAIQTQLDAKLASASYTAADVLSKLLTVDGAGSGLDADLLDGISSSGFGQVSSGSFTGTVTGCTTSPTCTVKWLKIGNLVLVEVGANNTYGTSNTSDLTMTGVPAAIRPASSTAFSTPISGVWDNTAYINSVTVSADAGSGTWRFIKNTGGAGTDWTSSGNKGFPRQFSFMFMMN